jgi:hypothetical protein
VYIDKKSQKVFVNDPQQSVTDLLAKSENAIREGKAQEAYQFSLQATQTAPESIEAWLMRATLAPTLDERLVCVNRLNELAPGYQDRYNVAFFALKELLDKNPYLAYLEETEELYRVASRDRVLTIPKKRAPTEPYPPERPTRGPLTSAYRWLIMAFAGLLVAGIGAVLFAPLAALAAIQAQGSLRSRSEQVSATVALVASLGLFIVGVLFSLLFVLHWLG